MNFLKRFAGENGMKHVIVYEHPDGFCGWPANNGIWTWDGKEILVGFTLGGFEEKPGHNIKEPYRSMLARSTDQGDTWKVFQPENFVRPGVTATALTEPLNFTSPGFAMRVVGIGYHGSNEPSGMFFASNDRGATWQGPYSFGDLMQHGELAGLSFTSRTDYVVEGPREMLVLMSARKEGGGMVDRTFCARTTDGGLTFRFVSWMVPPSDPYRAVMPATVSLAASRVSATVRFASGRLVAAVRRREIGVDRSCWIDAYASTDGGATWKWLVKIGDTGGHNGNPPALTKLRDGRLCCVFGNRDQAVMLAKFSEDEGRTWRKETVLRDDFQRDRHNDPDMGYPRVFQRADGKLMAVYYWATKDHFHHHIAGTIWEPED